MAIIDFKKIILELSNDSFEKLKEKLKDVLNYFYISQEEISKSLLLEKIGDYQFHFEMKNSKVRDNDFSKVYVDELYSLLKGRVLSYKDKEYFNKLTEIKDNINKYKDDQLIEKLEDFTKVFVCLYDRYINKAQNEDFYLNVRTIDLESFVEYFSNDKPESNAVVKKVENIIESQEVLNQAADNIKSLQGNINKFREKFAKKDTSDEPIHDVVEKIKSENIYNSRTFSYILLLIFYYRALDFEEGKDNEN